MIDHRNVRLGRIKTPDEQLAKCLKLAKYLDLSQLPVAPDTLDWSNGGPSNWGMMLNDRVGDCAVAAPGHIVQVASLVASSSMVTISDADIKKAYMAISGWNGVIGSNSDVGCNMVEVLDYWTKTGIGGHKIQGFATINPTHVAMARVAHWLFGALYVGYALPTTAQNQAVWDVAPGMVPGDWGGHAVTRVRHDPKRRTVITWGELQETTEAFDNACCDELHAIIMPEWTPNGVNVAGFDAVTLAADLPLVAL
jgi:hypothetical protein